MVLTTLASLARAFPSYSSAAIKIPRRTFSHQLTRPIKKAPLTLSSTNRILHLDSSYQPGTIHSSLYHHDNPAAPSRTFTTKASSNAIVTLIKQKNTENPVIVYSKTYCPYCSEVKQLFSSLSVPAKVIELDEIADGTDVQAGIEELTGRRTVPQVFVGGRHVGGCDDTMAAFSSGELKSMLTEVGIAI